MKKILLTLALTSLVATAFGQGQVQFRNYLATPSINAPVYLDTIGGTLLSGANPEYRAALVGGGVGSTPWGLAVEGNLSMLFHPTATTVSWVIFDSRTAPGQTPGYVRIGTQAARLVPTVNWGQQGLFQLVAWEGSTYTTFGDAWRAAQAGNVRIGVSNPVTVTLPASAQDVNLSYLVGLQSFAIQFVPEPTTFALAGLGAAALLIFRRRN